MKAASSGGHNRQPQSLRPAMQIEPINIASRLLPLKDVRNRVVGQFEI